MRSPFKNSECEMGGKNGEAWIGYGQKKAIRRWRPGKVVTVR